ncbi:hypothetical protein P9B78_16400, partial [Bacillus paralicheniformis]
VWSVTKAFSRRENHPLARVVIIYICGASVCFRQLFRKMYSVPAIFLLFWAVVPVQNFPFSELFSMMGRTIETRNRKCHDELKTIL